MQNIQKTIEKLTELSTPLSPFESVEDRDKQRSEWHSRESDETFEILLQLLCHPIDPEIYAPAKEEYFIMEIVEALESIGKRDPDKYFDLIKQNINNTNARPALIEVVGELGHQESVELLANVLAQENPDEQEKINIACALGNIGNDNARRVLLNMQSALTADDAELANEIDIALGSI